MRRRSFTLGGLFAAGLAALGLRARAASPAIEGYEAAEAARKAFPYKLIEVRGDQALVKWKEMKEARRGTPVVLGGDDSGMSNLFDVFLPETQKIWPRPSPEEVLARAAKINFPAGLIARRAEDDKKARELFERQLKDNPDAALPTIVLADGQGHSRTLSRTETMAQLQALPHEPALGDWPTEPDSSAGLTVAYDLHGTPLPKVYIALIPTDDWTAIPAYMRWGGWNECPDSEFHVAALRSWRDRYGVELVGLGFDTMNLTAIRPPKTREEAIALAKEQYVYCSDIIDQGVQTYSALAAALMAGDWWFFWWD